MRDLRVYFGSPRQPVKAVDGVSFRIRRGETLALVGESGCGKSVTAMSLARLVPEPPAYPAGGEVLVGGRNVYDMSAADVRRLRGKDLAYIFQEPGQSLNPVMRIADQLAEAVVLHRRGVDVGSEVERLLSLVGIADPARVARAFPHELSGGLQQRVMIAMALSSEPGLLVADEPTTALDVTIQAQVLALLRSLQQQLGMGILFITHNLGLVADLAHTVHVMYAGRIVESGPVEDVLGQPRHPYTRALMEAVPTLAGGAGRLAGIQGSVPRADALPPGCPFHPRCPRAVARCASDVPAWQTEGTERGIRCHFWR